MIKSVLSNLNILTELNRNWVEAVLICSLNEEQDNESSVGPPENKSSSWITGGIENKGTSAKSLKSSRFKRQNVERGGKKMAVVSMGT